jgi:hypothetical protein
MLAVLAWWRNIARWTERIGVLQPQCRCKQCMPGTWLRSSVAHLALQAEGKTRNGVWESVPPPILPRSALVDPAHPCGARYGHVPCIHRHIRSVQLIF